MIVSDTAALISLATADTLELVLAEFDVRTTELVLGELADTAEYDDSHGRAAQDALDARTNLTAHAVGDPEIESARVDGGEASCTALARQADADFLVTDDLRALPELQALTDARVAISPIVLKALVKRGVLDRHEAEERLESMADARDWLGSPIYRRAKHLFKEPSR
jgi:predicted nucleic acid-binding protein